MGRAIEHGTDMAVYTDDLAAAHARIAALETALRRYESESESESESEPEVQEAVGAGEREKPPFPVWFVLLMHVCVATGFAAASYVLVWHWMLTGGEHWWIPSGLGSRSALLTTSCILSIGTGTFAWDGARTRREKQFAAGLLLTAPLYIPGAPVISLCALAVFAFVLVVGAAAALWDRATGVYKILTGAQERRN